MADSHKFSSFQPLPESFQYQALNLGAQEFRLLRIRPKQTGSRNVGPTFECELIHADLNKAPQYNALSYTWGKPTDDTHAILMNGKSYHVRDNLSHALLRLQSTLEGALLLWVDAVCIDQANLTERNHQVGQMRKIYEHAHQLVIWLGLAKDDSEIAFKLLQDLYRHRDSKEAIAARYSHPEIAQELKAVASLFFRPYWDRIWIVQEVILGRNPLIYCGGDIIEAPILSKVQQEIFVLDERGLNLSETVLADDIETWRALCYRGPRTIESSHPRDMIYGLVGLTDALDGQALEIDYARSVGQVYKDFSEYDVSTSKKLRLLTWLNLDFPRMEDLPSWVPDWSQSTSGHCFIENPFVPQTRVRAAGDTKADVTFPPNDATAMIVKGFDLGRIEQLGQRTEIGRTHDNEVGGVRAFHNWHRLLDALPGDEYTKQEAFGRTLIINQVAETHPLTLEEHFRAVLGAFANLSSRLCPEIPLDTIVREFMDYKFSAIQEEHEGWAPGWIKFCLCYMWDRRFFTGTSHTMGLAPRPAVEGDVVCVLLGCSQPMILHPTTQEGHFRVVGPAYVDGFMHGKAVERWKAHELQVEEFILC